MAVDLGDGTCPAIDSLVTVYTRGIGEAAHIERADTWRVRGVERAGRSSHAGLNVRLATPEERDSAIQADAAERDERERHTRRAPKERLDAIAAMIRRLSDEQRLDVMGRFCRGCGTEQGATYCHCQNDE